MMNYDSFVALDIAREGDVLNVRLKGGGDMNAFRPQMHTEFASLFPMISADDVRVVILSGEGNHFSVAADMRWYSNIDSDEWVRLMREAKAIVHGMLNLPQPIVISMNGDAIGLGSSIVSLGDFVIAVEGAKIADHHLDFGLVCGDGGAMTYPFLMGLGRAKELFMLGREFTVEELKDMGVINRVVPRSDLDSAVDDVVRRLLQMPREALEWTKQTLNRVVQFNSFLSTDFSLGHEGWSWYLDPSQRFLKETRESFDDVD